LAARFQARCAVSLDGEHGQLSMGEVSRCRLPGDLGLEVVAFAPAPEAAKAVELCVRGSESGLRTFERAVALLLALFEEALSRAARSLARVSDRKAFTC